MYRFLSLALTIFISTIESAKILTVLPIPSSVHQIVYRPLIESLHKSGHHLTILTTDPFFFSNLEQYENITEIDLSFVYHLDVLNELKNADLEGSDMLKTVFNVMRKLFEAELKSPVVKQLLSGDEYFDAVLVDWSGSSSMMNIFAHHFNAPLIGITNGEAFPNIHEAFGNPNHPVSFPSVFLPFTENLSLVQRIFSVFSAISYKIYYHTEEIPLQNEIIAGVMKYENAPDMWEIESNADLVLINSYEMLNNIRPTVPTTVYLGGLHEKTQKTNLPEDLKEFLKKSERVVYVNLNGAIQHSQARFEKLLKALKKANVAIIWNLNDGFINTTARVYQGFDLDQESILAHAKVILHITDGGQRNIEDSIHHAVPILGISYSTSLDHYLYQVQKYVCGVVSLIDFESHEKFEKRLDDVLKTKIYKSNMIKLRNIVKDQPHGNSVECAIWWIEYVIRHGGTKHLRNEQKTISWMKYLMLDVALTVFIGFASTLFVFAYIFGRVRSYSKSLPFERVTRGSKMKVL